MKGILAIYRREINGYFVSPIAYIVIGFFLALTGVFFFTALSRAIEYAFRAQMQAQQFGAPPEIDVPSLVIRNFIGVTATLLLFLIPMLTMGTYAEERKRGTMEMLMTSPITEFQIVIGKFLASLTLFVFMLIPTIVYFLVMSRFSEPAIPWKIVWSGYLGIFLLGAALLAIGTFISSLTENQIVAGVATFVVFLLLWIIDMVMSGASSIWAEILKYLSVLQHYDTFAQGVIDTSSIIFYVSVIALGLFLTLRTLDSMRWRRA